VTPSGANPVDAGDFPFSLGTTSIDIGEGVNFVSFAITSREDAEVEPDETYTVTLTETTVGTISATESAAEVIVFNDDLPPPVFAITATGPRVVTEGSAPDTGGVVRFTIERISGDLGPAEVMYAQGAGVAPGIDPWDVDSGVGTYLVLFAQGQMRAEIEVPFRPDLTEEPDESLRIALVRTDFGSVDRTPVDFTILNDDGPPEVAFAAADVGSVFEGGGTVGGGQLTFTLTRTDDPFAATSVLFTIGGDVDAADVTVSGASLSAAFPDTLGLYRAEFALGETEAVITITATPDSTIELDEAVTLQIRSISGGVIAPTGAAIATGTILNDDLGPPPVLGPQFYFSGFSPGRGRELWVHDTNTQVAGEAPQARPVVGAEWVSGPGSSDPREITSVGETVFFRVDDQGTLRWLAYRAGQTTDIFVDEFPDYDADFDASLPLEDRTLSVQSGEFLWISGPSAFRGLSTGIDIMYGFNDAFDADPFWARFLYGEDKRGLTALPGGFGYIAKDASGEEQIYVVLKVWNGPYIDFAQPVTDETGGSLTGEIAAFSPRAPLDPASDTGNVSVFFSGARFDRFGTLQTDALWRVDVQGTEFGWQSAEFIFEDPEFVDVNGTAGALPVAPDKLTLAETGGGERLFFFGRVQDANGDVGEALFALDEAANGDLSWQSTDLGLGVPLLDGTDIAVYRDGVAVAAVSGAASPEAVVYTWTDADGDGTFTLSPIFAGNGGTIEDLVTDADGNIAFTWDYGFAEELFVFLPDSGGGAPELRFVADRAGAGREIDEVQLAGGKLVYRASSDVGDFATLFVHDLATGVGAEIITDEPLNSGTGDGLIGGSTLVTTAFGVAFQASFGAGFGAPVVFTSVEGEYPLLPGQITQGFGSFGFGTGIAYDGGWIGTGYSATTATLGLHRMDGAGNFTTLYTDGTNFAGDLAGLDDSILFGTTSSAVNNVLTHDLATGATTTLLTNHLLGQADAVGSQIVFSARDNSRPINRDADPDNDIWTLYTYNGSAVETLGDLPVFSGFGQSGPVRTLNETGAAFLGDDEFIFWTQRSDTTGSEIHRYDLFDNALTVIDLAPGAASGSPEFGTAVYAGGRLFFIGFTDSTGGGNAVWMLDNGSDTPVRVTGPDLRDPFGFHAELTVLPNGEVFFVAMEESTGSRRLFQINDDGVTADLVPTGGAFGNIFFIEGLGDTLGFTGSDALGNRQVFTLATGATAADAGPVIQRTAFAERSDFLGDITFGGDEFIYFGRSEPQTGRELWVIDPTAPEGARLIADLNLTSEPAGYQPEQVTAPPVWL
jgi:ELWxxDGT repeat protein